MLLSHFGEKKNLPIVRIGTIAAMPGEPLETSYGTHDAFLIEVRSIDGLSGSPVCINLEHRRFPFTMPARPLPHPNEVRHLTFFVGMVLGHNSVSDPRDNIEIVRIREGKNIKEDAIVPMNNGIAVVLPVWRIIEAIDQPGIKEARAKVLALYDEGPKSAAPIGQD